MGTLDMRKNEILSRKQPMLSRLARSDTSRVLSSEYPKEMEQETKKYALRSVVDIKIGQLWCSGTVINRFHDNSIMVALHEEQKDENGRYRYKKIIKWEKMENVVHCIDEHGDHEIDDNPILKFKETQNANNLSFKSSAMDIKNKDIQISKKQNIANNNNDTKRQRK